MSTIDNIRTTCEALGILMDNEAPIEVTPGCFLFSGIERTPEFTKSGYGKYNRYYALPSHDGVTIELF